jgi:hypothetical protein
MKDFTTLIKSHKVINLTTITFCKKILVLEVATMSKVFKTYIISKIIQNKLMLKRWNK